MVDRYRLLCILVLFAITIILVVSVYNASGVGWDFLSRYLNGRTLASGYFYTHLGVFSTPAGGSAPALVVSKGIYFDKVWDPLTSVVIIPFVILLGSWALGAYLIFLVVLLFVASWFTSKDLGVDPLVLTSLMVGPFVIMADIFYNGSEILALSLALFTVARAVQKRYSAGFWAGLMGLARYDSLIIAPIAFLMGDRKKVVRTILLSVAVTVPWLAFNLLLFGNPIQSYLTDLAESQPQTGGVMVFLSLLKSVVWYPLIILAVAVVVLAYLKRDKIKKLRAIELFKKTLEGQRARILLAVLILSLMGFAFAYSHVQGALRLGYMVYLSVSLIASVVVSVMMASLLKKKARRIAVIIPYLVFFASVVLLLNLYMAWSSSHFEMLGSLGFRYPAYLEAVQALQAHGLANCSVLSNAWPYLDYYNVTTYAPYLCNATMERLPVVDFNDGTGVSDYCGGSIRNITGVSERFNYSNFTILLPLNHSCG